MNLSKTAKIILAIISILLILIQSDALLGSALAGSDRLPGSGSVIINLMLAAGVIGSLFLATILFSWLTGNKPRLAKWRLLIIPLVALGVDSTILTAVFVLSFVFQGVIRI